MWVNMKIRPKNLFVLSRIKLSLPDTTFKTSVISVCCYILRVVVRITSENNKILPVIWKEKETRYVKIKLLYYWYQGWMSIYIILLGSRLNVSFLGERSDMKDGKVGCIQIWHWGLCQVGSLRGELCELPAYYFVLFGWWCYIWQVWIPTKFVVFAFTQIYLEEL